MDKEKYKDHLLDDRRLDSKTPKEILTHYRLLLGSMAKIESLHCNRDVCDNESYHYVAFPPSSFIDILFEGFVLLGGDSSKKFLDIGCGIGTTVLMASNIFDAYGFDYNKELTHRAQFIVGDRVCYDDAKTFNRYEQFDFIYYYRPFVDDNLQYQLEERIFNGMKVGSLVCPILNVFDWDIHTEKVGEFTYQKVA